MSSLLFRCVECNRTMTPTRLKNHLADMHGIERISGAKKLLFHVRMIHPQPDAFVWEWIIKDLILLELVNITYEQYKEIDGAIYMDKIQSIITKNL